MRTVIAFLAGLALGVLWPGPEPAAAPRASRSAVPLPSPSPSLRRGNGRETAGSLLARATVAVHEGDVAAAIAAAEAAVAAGASPADALASFRELPDAAAAVRELLARRGVEWTATAEFALACFELGADAEGFDLALRAMSAEGAGNDALVRRLVQCDPERAAREIGALADRDAWSAEWRARIVLALEAFAREDLARTLVLAADASGRVTTLGDLFEALERLDPRAALARAERICDAHPEADAAWCKLAGLQLASGDRERALDTLARAAERFPDSSEIAMWLADLDSARAVPVLRRVADATANDEVAGVLGKALLRLGRLEEAVDAFLAAHERDWTDWEWLRAVSELDPKRAIERTDALLGVVSTRSATMDEVVGARARALHRTGDAVRAFEAYERAWALDREDSEWMRGLAEVDPARALPLFEAWLASGGEDRNVRGAMGDACARLGRTAEARAHYEAAVQDEVSEWDAALARVDPDGAIARLRARVGAQPTNADLWATLADAFHEAGRVADARAAYDRAVELAPLETAFLLKRAALR